MAMILDGKVLASQQKPALKTKAHSLSLQLGRLPCLAVILVGDDPASQIYVNRKASMCVDLGIRSIVHRLSSTIAQADLTALIHQLNENDTIDGILLQLPLPNHLDSTRAIQAILPTKDVDGLHPENQGYLFQGKPKIVPCTPAGCLQLLKNCCDDLTGVKVVVVGSSILVGRPLALLLMQQGATVTIANSKTRNLSAITRQADIVVSATGRPHLITSDHVKEGAIIIDVGITKVNDSLVGDVDFANVEKKASFITPVPGGVGPMTIINLMANILKAAEIRHHDKQTDSIT